MEKGRKPRKKRKLDHRYFTELKNKIISYTKIRRFPYRFRDDFFFNSETFLKDYEYCRLVWINLNLRPIHRVGCNMLGDIAYPHVHIPQDKVPNVGRF